MTGLALEIPGDYVDGMKIELAENDIHLWLLPFDTRAGQDCLKKNRDVILHREEMRRFNRLKVDRVKVEYLSSRILLRFLLSLYTELPAAGIEIIADEMGRPFFYHQGLRLPLYFSLSHTRNFICCLLSRREKAGCDIEGKKPRKYQTALYRYLFSEEEFSFCQQLPKEEQQHFFFTSWTLKEAFIKAQGKGLRIPLTSLSFTHGLWKKSSCRLSPEPNHPDLFWQFHSLSPEPQYLAGVAIQAPDSVLSLFPAILHNGQVYRAA